MQRAFTTLAMNLGLLSALCGTAALAQNQKSGGTATLIEDVDNPARQPFTFMKSYSSPGNGVSIDVPVPAGKRLVIETVSVTSQVAAGTGVVPHAYINAMSGGALGYIGLPLVDAFKENNLEFWASTQAVRFYADPNSSVYLTVMRTADSSGCVCGSFGGVVSISGHFVNLP